MAVDLIAVTDTLVCSQECEATVAHPAVVIYSAIRSRKSCVDMRTENEEDRDTRKEKERRKIERKREGRNKIERKRKETKGRRQDRTKEREKEKENKKMNKREKEK